MYAHVFAPSTALDPGWAPPAQFWWFNDGYAAVLVFFALSGSVIGLTTTRPATGGETSRYLGRRALRLAPINTVAVLLAWFILPIASGLTLLGNLLLLQNDQPYPGGFHVGLLVNNQNLWSLNYEVVYYLAFIALWRWAPRARWVWLGLVALALTAATGRAEFKVFAHWACGGLYWLAGLAIAWQTPTAGGPIRGNWPAALLAAHALWVLAPLRDALIAIEGYAFMAMTPASLHRLDFLPACAWLLLAVTGRAPAWQRGLTRLCLVLGALGLAHHVVTSAVTAPLAVGGVALAAAGALRT
jgi:peptidoglycan/LPS O-acetylase OafA/YrhL